MIKNFDNKTRTEKIDFPPILIIIKLMKGVDKNGKPTYARTSTRSIR